MFSAGDGVGLDRGAWSCVDRGDAARIFRTLAVFLLQKAIRVATSYDVSIAVALSH